MAYADTNVFDLGSGMQPVAMVFERAGGRWKLATAVDHPDGAGWPALCTQGAPPAGAAVLAAGSYAPDLARVLTNANTGTAQTTRERLAGRQPGRHAQARRRAPRERHVHHHLHGHRPAAHG